MQRKFLKSLFAAFFFALAAAVSSFAQPPSLVDTKLPETKTIDAAGLKNLLPNAEKKQPVLLNFWATWCGPCRAEFPELVKIDLDYHDKNLNFALVSVDNAALIKTSVPEFLRQYEATAIPSYLLDYPTRPQIARAVRQIAPGFVDRYPLTLLFDHHGRLVYRKNGVINAKILRAEIDKVLPKIANQP